MNFVLQRRERLPDLPEHAVPDINDDFCIKMMNFVLKMMNVVLKMMNFVLFMMDFVLNMMNFVLK